MTARRPRIGILGIMQDLYDEMNGWGLDEVGRCTWHPSLNLEWDDNHVVTRAEDGIDEGHVLTTVNRFNV